jgi:hypothetical protein
VDLTRGGLEAGGLKFFGFRSIEGLGRLGGLRLDRSGGDELLLGLLEAAAGDIVAFALNLAFDRVAGMMAPRGRRWPERRRLAATTSRLCPGSGRARRATGPIRLSA